MASIDRSSIEYIKQIPKLMEMMNQIQTALNGILTRMDVSLNIAPPKPSVGVAEEKVKRTKNILTFFKEQYVANYPKFILKIISKERLDEILATVGDAKQPHKKSAADKLKAEAKFVYDHLTPQEKEHLKETRAAMSDDQPDEQDVPKEEEKVPINKKQSKESHSDEQSDDQKQSKDDHDDSEVSFDDESSGEDIESEIEE